MPRRTRLSTSSSEDATTTTTSNTSTTTLPASSIPPPTTFTDTLPLPKLIVFDLDYTLWPFWVDTHVSPPLKPSSDSGLTVRDAHGGRYGFYTDVAGILSSIKSKNITLGAASRTCAPDLARKVLTLLSIPADKSEEQEEGSGKARRAIDLFDYMEIYPGSKIQHFKSLRKRTGMEYEEMLFFDDESRNKNVEELGVVMCLVRDGVSRGEMDRGVEMWRKRTGRMEK